MNRFEDSDTQFHLRRATPARKSASLLRGQDNRPGSQERAVRAFQQLNDEGCVSSLGGGKKRRENRQLKLETFMWTVFICPPFSSSFAGNPLFPHTPNEPP